MFVPRSSETPTAFTTTHVVLMPFVPFLCCWGIDEELYIFILVRSCTNCGHCSRKGHGKGNQKKVAVCDTAVWLTADDSFLFQPKKKEMGLV